MRERSKALERHWSQRNVYICVHAHRHGCYWWGLSIRQSCLMRSWLVWHRLEIQMNQQVGVREGETDAGGRRRRWTTSSSCRRFSAVLQSFPWSEDSAVAQPQALHDHRTRAWQTSQPARHVVHVRPCVWKLDCAPKCVRAIHVHFIYRCAHTLFPVEQSSLPFRHSFALRRRHQAKMEQEETYGTPSCTEQPLSNMEDTWVHVTCMMRPLPLG